MASIEWRMSNGGRQWRARIPVPGPASLTAARGARRPGRRVFLGAALVVVFAAGGPIAAHAQIQARVNGYLEHQYSLSYSSGSWRHIDYDRLRADVNAGAGRESRLSAGAVWQLHRGDTRIRLRDVLPSELGALVDTISVPIQDRLYLNHAYVTLRPGGVELVAGKQYLTWGAALVFNPTELFRPKNVLDPAYDREGIGALSARIPIGPLSDVLFGFVPEGGLRTSGRLVRVRHHAGGFDLSALAAFVHERPIGLALLLPGSTERRITLGGDVTGELFGLGTWAEAAWSDHAGEQWVEAVAGGNYTLSDGTLLMAEGFYNGRGKWSDPYPPSLWVSRLFGGMRSLGKGLVFAGASRPVGERQLWNVGLSGLANAGDPSGVLIPSVSYAFAENVDLLFNAHLYLGRDGAEFGGRRFGGFVRGRVYF
jgi:hypothetical protein